MNIIKVDPKEYGLEVDQVSTIEQAFLPKIQEREGLSVIYEQLIQSELTPELAKQAKDIRLKLVKVRTGIADIHKTQKAYFLAAGRFVDAWKNKETLPVEQMEEKLFEIEDYFPRLERERIEKLNAERTELVRQYTDFPANGLGVMTDEVFNAYFTGCKVAYDAKIEAEKKAEEERLAAIESERIERERIKTENERLKAEAEQREKEIAAEREKAESERKEIEEKARKEREELEAEKQRLLKIEREKAEKLEAELKAKRDAEIAEQQQKEAEEKARIKAEKEAAKAPRKEKLTKWVESFEISKFENDELAEEINAKFMAFKKWAKSQIESI